MSELFVEWIALYEKCVEKYAGTAAPFFGHVPDGFKKQSPRILYVGKATARDFLPKGNSQVNLLVGEKVISQLEHAKGVFSREIGKSGPSFWGFANDLSQKLDPHCHAMENLAWSNLCKIGHSTDNPSGGLLADQRALAIKTVREEIRLLDPSIVLFVSKQNGEEILRDAIEASDKDFFKSEDDQAAQVDDVWWLPPGGNRKYAVIWMRHPQGAPLKLRQFAIKKCLELVNKAKSV